MSSLDNLRIELTRKSSLTLIILFFLIFICLEYILFSRLSAKRYLDKGINYLDEYLQTPQELLSERSLFYSNALKSLNRASALNPYDSKSYFEYGQAIAQIVDDSEFISSLDSINSGTQKKGRPELCNLAKYYYTKAILREPLNAIYYQRLGSIYDKLSNTKEAEDEFNKAITLEPQNISIHLYLSQYFLSKNNEKGFDYHLQKAVDLYYRADLRGGPISDMVEDFLRSANREDLIKKRGQPLQK